ncbi:MAG: hypothetical protein GY847_09850 [Proteobacteria bacterium]|nr:hypothetical protein [Pseudomonadota bacterium]
MKNSKSLSSTSVLTKCWIVLFCTIWLVMMGCDSETQQDLPEVASVNQALACSIFAPCPPGQTCSGFWEGVCQCNPLPCNESLCGMAVPDGCGGVQDCNCQGIHAGKVCTTGDSWNTPYGNLGYCFADWECPATMPCGTVNPSGVNCPGICSSGEQCNLQTDGTYQCKCSPQCSGAQCGDSDGCGGYCLGSCNPGDWCAPNDPGGDAGNHCTCDASGGSDSCASVGTNAYCAGPDGGNCVCTENTCSNFPGQCGNLDNGCGGTINCNCPGGSACVNGLCECQPNCSGKNCGNSDECGGECNGPCVGPQDTCVTDPSGNGYMCECQPNCSGKTCGQSDGCGGTCNGSCSAGDTCQTDGNGNDSCVCDAASCSSQGSNASCVAGHCSCTQNTCGNFPGQCGNLDNGCGGTINCGCASNETCNNGLCECQPDCSGKTCGQSDECGGTCNGSCSAGDTCNTDGNGNHSCVCDAASCSSQGSNATCVAGNCSCTENTCNDLQGQCGSLDNGCGGTISCNCGTDETCISGQCELFQCGAYPNQTVQEHIAANPARAYAQDCGSSGGGVIVFDDFASGLDQWIETGEGDWNTESRHSSSGYPSDGTGSPAAHSDNCDSSCTLELQQRVDLTQFSQATLNFLRFVDSSLDSGEYLRVQLWNGSSWVTEYDFTNGAGDTNRWESESFDLASYMNVSDFSVRLVTKSSRSDEHVHIDDFEIVTPPNTLFCYYAIGSDDALGQDSGAAASLWETSPGFFTTDGSSCQSCDCDNRECGNNLCGQDCGTCPPGYFCYELNLDDVYYATCEPHCANGRQDYDETGVDCGGSCNTICLDDCICPEDAQCGDTNGCGGSCNGVCPPLTRPELTTLPILENDTFALGWHPDRQFGPINGEWTGIQGSTLFLTDSYIEFGCGTVAGQPDEGCPPLTTTLDQHVINGRVTTWQCGGDAGTGTQLFFDDFSSGLGQWIETGEGDWKTESLHSSSNYNGSSGSPAAHSDNCDSECTLEMAIALDLTNATNATLSFERFLDSRIDNSEYLSVELWDGSQWITEYYWTNGDGDTNSWASESMDLSAYLGVSDFGVRLVTRSSRSDEHVHVDDLLITADFNSAPSTCYSAVGSDEDLGQDNGDDTVTLYETSSGVFETDNSSCAAGPPSFTKDVFYQFSICEETTVSIDMSGSIWAPVMGLFPGDVSNFTPSNVITCQAGSSGSPPAINDVLLTPGNYWVVLRGDAALPANFALFLHDVTGARPYCGGGGPYQCGIRDICDMEARILPIGKGPISGYGQSDNPPSVFPIDDNGNDCDPEQEVCEYLEDRPATGIQQEFRQCDENGVEIDKSRAFDGPGEDDTCPPLLGPCNCPLDPSTIDWNKNCTVDADCIDLNQMCALVPVQVCIDAGRTNCNPDIANHIFLPERYCASISDGSVNALGETENRCDPMPALGCFSGSTLVTRGTQTFYDCDDPDETACKRIFECPQAHDVPLANPVPQISQDNKPQETFPERSTFDGFGDITSQDDVCFMRSRSAEPGATTVDNPPKEKADCDSMAGRLFKEYDPSVCTIDDNGVPDCANFPGNLPPGVPDAGIAILDTLKIPADVFSWSNCQEENSATVKKTGNDKFGIEYEPHVRKILDVKDLAQGEANINIDVGIDWKVAPTVWEKEFVLFGLDAAASLSRCQLDIHASVTLLTKELDATEMGNFTGVNPWPLPITLDTDEQKLCEQLVGIPKSPLQVLQERNYNMPPQSRDHFLKMMFQQDNGLQTIANRAKKALADARLAIEYLRSLPVDGSGTLTKRLDTGFCIATVNELQDEAGFEWLSGVNCDNPPTEIINAWILKYAMELTRLKNKPAEMFGNTVTSEVRNLLNKLQVAPEPLELFKELQDFTEEIVSLSFPVGPISVVMEIAAGGSYGALGQLYYEFKPTLLLDPAVEKNSDVQIAKAGFSVEPRVGAWVSVFVGAGVGTSFLGAHVGIEGILDLIQIGIPVNAEVALKRSTLDDTRAPTADWMDPDGNGNLPQDTSNPALFPVHAGLHNWSLDTKLSVDLWYEALSGRIDLKARIALLFYTIDIQKTMIRFAGVGNRETPYELWEATGPRPNISLGQFSADIPLPVVSLLALPNSPDDSVTDMSDWTPGSFGAFSGYMMGWDVGCKNDSIGPE